MIPLSGFFVFIVSSKLFGAEGRGIIAYGTAIVSIISLLLSFNLGRTFLFVTKNNTKLKQKLLFSFLALNCIIIFGAMCIISFYWLISSQSQKIIPSPIFYAFLMLTPYYIWSIVNGNNIFSAINLTTMQDVIIGIQRLVLILFMMLLLFLDIDSFSFFIFIYAGILSGGACYEIISLARISKGFTRIINIKHYLFSSKVFHVDYLAFHLYPSILVIVSGIFLELTQLGRLNFMIQLLNLIFLLAVVASIRIKTYVASKGSLYFISSIKVLLVFTSTVSIIAVFLIYNALKTSYFGALFPSFDGLSSYFLMLSLAIPGYVTYQFIYPMLLEHNLMSLSMKANLFILIFMSFISYPLVKHNGFEGSIILFILFYFLIFISQLYIYLKILVPLNKVKGIYN